jgi:hypothetical protein
VSNYLPVLLFVACLGGCTAYQPLPLQTSPQFPAEVPHLVVQAERMPLPELASHHFDPDDGLDMTEVAILAVVNNPQLRVTRDEAGIASAQAFAAGLLPDPQLSLTQDFPTNGTSGNTSAFNLGLNYDVNALLTLSAAKNAAQAALRQTDLNLLWQEWQVVSQARLLFVRNMGQQQLLAVLQKEHALLFSRYQLWPRATSPWMRPIPILPRCRRWIQPSTILYARMSPIAMNSTPFSASRRTCSFTSSARPGCRPSTRPG